ncbi:MAG: hypothetical protein J7474_08695 [Arthrobacter sp.]|nr:hypothetical protein [Arthrobacter sp.]
MPVSKKRKNARKAPKRYRWVTFTNDLFEDEFTLPDLAQMPGSVTGPLVRGDVESMYIWLEELGVDGDAMEAIRSMDSGEFQAFQKDWTKGNLADVPKSSD